MSLSGSTLGLIIFAKILAMFVVAFVGWLLRRNRVLDAAMTSTLSRLLTDLIFPALVVAKLIDLVSWQTLRESAHILGLGAVTLLFVCIAAELFARATLPRASRNTGAFLVAIPNWIFMPLPIVTALYGNDGVHALLLINVAMQFLLWTGGVWMLARGAAHAHPLEQLKSNRGLQATAAAFVLGLIVPATASLPGGDAMHVAIKICRALVDGVDMLGSLTVPLTLVVLGAQLGGLTSEHVANGRTLGTVVTGRLLIVPVFSAAMLTVLHHFGLAGSPVVQNVMLIIIAMPVAVTCAAFTERFGGDIALGARSILISTLFSVLSVPVFVVLVQQIWMRF
jgi:predicted permease